MMPQYVQGILAQGNCPALVSGGVFSSQGRTFFAWDRSGLISIRQAAKRESLRLGCSSARAFLALAVRVAAAFEEAYDWLIPQECLDVSPDRVWYNVSEKRVVFCLAEGNAADADRSKSPSFALFELLLELAALEVPEAYPFMEKLSERAAEEHLSFSAIKKELSLRLTGPG